MTLTRRRLLQGAGATLAMTGLGTPRAWASTELMLGDMQIQTLSDGTLTLPKSFLFDAAAEAEFAPIIQEFGLGGDTLTPECNVTLVRQGDNVILFDAGSGDSFQDSAGQLPDALDAAGVAPEDVTHVVFTHAHPDHLWGVLDDFDDPLFSEAQHMIGKAEWDYWTNPATVDEIGQERASFAVGAMRRLEALEDSMAFIEPGQEILPGVMAHASFGHTPGHLAFELRGGSESVMVLGDSVANNHVAFLRPDWAGGGDQDHETAAKTRVKLLDHVTQDKMRLIGFHLPGGGIGRAERKDGAYRFVPEGA